MSENKNVVNLFDMSVDDTSMTFLDKKNTNKDGIYRVNSKDGKDKQKGYVATIRFLPNVLEDMTLGPSAIERYVHYANLPDYPDLKGYYDSQKQIEGKCPLNQMFWKLYNSKNAAEVERSSLIKGSPKYYSYVLIIEDEQQPELEGKIMIFPYGIKIKDKINLERQGENSTGKKCNVFDPANGKDFRLIVKEIGGYQNYDSSSFREESPLKIWDSEKKKFVTLPIEWNEEKQKNAITNPKVQTKLFDFLTKRENTAKIEDFLPKKWTEQEASNVEKIIDILSGKDINIAKSKIQSTSKATSKTEELDESPFTNSEDSDDLDEFFGSMEDDN
jgi:hypothetical protein